MNLYWLLLTGLCLARTHAWMPRATDSLSSTTTALAMATTPTTEHMERLTQVLEQVHPLPKLLVFDLDNTLWTPELYQIRKKSPPRVNQDIHLFGDALPILQALQQQHPEGISRPQLAVASRTNKVVWARQLLRDFTIDGPAGRGPSVHSLMGNHDALVQIQPGSKKTHFSLLREATGFAYSEMLFFDDDMRMNLGEISQLGVLCCHTPRGITTEHFCRALTKYGELKAGHDAAHWMGYVLNNENLGITEATVTSGKRLQGRVKFFSVQKRFGFVVDEASGEEFFFHESKVPAGMEIQTGDTITFESAQDPQGRASAVILSGAKGASAPNAAADQVTLPCFTMSQPFAALLLNGVKTVESRNNPMFQELAPGTQVLLHAGRRDWPDQESYRKILSPGLSSGEIDRVARLPKGFRKGNILGVITVGRTWKATDAERRGSDLQGAVLAPFEAIGKYCTEITTAQWLQKPVTARGSPGIYQAEIPRSSMPAKS
jgi:magnesium-dependent phosphatase 1